MLLWHKDEELAKEESFEKTETVKKSGTKSCMVTIQQIFSSMTVRARINKHKKMKFQNKRKKGTYTRRIPVVVNNDEQD